MRTCLSIVMILICLAICSARPAYSVNLDSILDVLDHEIALRQTYYNSKEAHIASVRSSLSGSISDKDSFRVLDILYGEFRQYQSDSALYYSKRLEDIAKESGNNVMEMIALSKRFDYFLSVWLIDEALADYRSIDSNLLPHKDKLLFFKNCVNLFYRLGFRSDYTCGSVEECVRSTESYVDSIVVHSLPGTFDHEFYRLSTEQKNCPPSVAIKRNFELLSMFDFSDHERALLYASISELAGYMGDVRLQAYCIAHSAIYDIRSSTHETASVFALADLMSQLEDMDRAVRYIRVAFDDALFFNSRVKQSQIGLILPMFETIRHDNVTLQRRIMAMLLIFISLSFLLSGVFLVKLIKRNRRLEYMSSSLDDARHKLVVANETLLSLNSMLKESIALKDSYIMQSLYINTSFLKQVEKKCREAINKMKTNGVEAMRLLPYQMGIKEERQRIMRSFDHTFLQVFPNFIEDFNALLRDGETVEPGEKGGMSNELRIFALMRLGIVDTTAVADFLNVSPNSIYVYKARLKSRSDLSKSEFDACVMAIVKP